MSQPWFMDWLKPPLMQKTALITLFLGLTFWSEPFVAQEWNPADMPQCPDNQVSTTRGCIDRPKLLSKTMPKYPRKARRQRLEGTVTLAVVLKIDGSIGEVQIKESVPAGVGFEESAIKAVKSWRYEPIVNEGKPMAIWFTVIVDFKHDRDEP